VMWADESRAGESHANAFHSLRNGRHLT
jgi:hypothetical protein